MNDSIVLDFKKYKEYCLEYYGHSTYKFSHITDEQLQNVKLDNMRSYDPLLPIRQNKGLLHTFGIYSSIEAEAIHSSHAVYLKGILMLIHSMGRIGLVKPITLNFEYNLPYFITDGLCRLRALEFLQTETINCTMFAESKAAISIRDNIVKHCTARKRDNYLTIVNEQDGTCRYTLYPEYGKRFDWDLVTTVLVLPEEDAFSLKLIECGFEQYLTWQSKNCEQYTKIDNLMQLVQSMQ